MTSRRQPPAKRLTDAQAEVFAILRDNGPTHARTVAELTGKSINSALPALRQLRAMGMCANTNNGPFTRWCLPWQVKAARAETAAQLKAKAAASLLLRQQKDRIRKALEREQRAANSPKQKPAEFVDYSLYDGDDSEDALLTPSRRIVPAAECKRPSRIGPNSVFNLATA